MQLWFERALIGGDWHSGVRIIVADGCIASIETGAEPLPGEPRHGPAIPGVPNLHSHAFQRAMSGLTERAGEGPDSFWTWRDLMYRFVAALDPEALAAIAALAFVEMLESGFTRVGEFHYLHNMANGAPYADPAAMSAALAEAAAASGIGLTLLPVFYAASDFGGAPPQPGQRRFVQDLDGFARLLESAATHLRPLGGAVLGLAPHSLRAVTAEQLAALVPMTSGPVHIHIAEQRREVDACIAWSGQRPVEWLMDNAELDARWCLVHATHAEPHERRAIAESGAVVGLCPITEANLGDGIFSATDFLAAGGRFGVGSDSNVRIDAGEELRLLEYGQRLTGEGRNMLAKPGGSTGRRLFDMALAGGAQALGVSAGGLAVGEPADIVAFAPGHVASAAREGDALLDSWIFGGASGLIDRVWRAGRQLVSGGRHLARGEAEARYRAAVSALPA